MSLSKRKRRQRIKYRIRNKITGTPVRPRLSVYRSNRAIYCQIIDDTIGKTLVAASSLEDTVDSSLKKSDQAEMVGSIVAKRAIDAGVKGVVFDRSGYLYHGRIKALADGARKEGLII
jgi:large subunit ribosomal protein L18